MGCDEHTKIWELAPREILRLDGARGTTVRVTRGTLWLTLENDPRDIVLSKGESFTIDRGGLTLIEAQTSVTVCAQAWYVDAARIIPRHPGLSERVATPFRSAGAAGFERRWAPYY